MGKTFDHATKSERRGSGGASLEYTCPYLLDDMYTGKSFPEKREGHASLEASLVDTNIGHMLSEATLLKM